MAGKSKKELEFENKMLRRARRGEGLTTIVVTLIRWGGGVGIAFFFYLTIEALAGKSTESNLALKLVTDFNASDYLWKTLAAVFGIYGWNQRKLRKDTVQRLQGRNSKLETAIDPGRTSSRLTQRGDTRPEDMP